MSKQLKTAQDFVEQAFKEAETAVSARCNADNLFIWGGQLTTGDENDQFAPFLQAWMAVTFQWMMVEEIDKFYVKAADLSSLSANHNQLERIRLFGSVGDLDIRRDADTVHWRFISETVNALPDLPAFTTAVSFWNEAENNGRSFARHEQRYYQWLRDKVEQRVTHDWADLALANKQYLRQVHYLENGRVAFARYVDFE